MSQQTSDHLAPENDNKAHRRCRCEFSSGGVLAKTCAFHQRLLSAAERARDEAQRLLSMAHQVMSESENTRDTDAYRAIDSAIGAKGK